MRKPSKDGSCWSRGPAHHVDTEAGRASIISAGDAPWPELQPLEALGEDVRGDPGDLAEQVIEPLRPAEQVIEPLRPAEQRPGQQQRPLVTDPGQRPASGDEPFSCSAMSGS